MAPEASSVVLKMGRLFKRPNEFEDNKSKLECHCIGVVDEHYFIPN